MRFGVDIAAADVKTEAERRITVRYPLWKQLNIIRAGGDEVTKMAAFIDGIRAASNLLERNKRIPVNYRDDEHWQ